MKTNNDKKKKKGKKRVISSEGFAKVPIRQPEDFERIRNYLIQNKKEFQLVHSGSITKIRYNGKEYSHFDVKEMANKGFHISKIFRKDVDNYIANNQVYPHPKTYKEQAFCLGHIESIIGQPVELIDIANCYWDTAHNLGYMTDETHIVGRRKDEWKTGRNAAIGSICKREYITKYVDGKVGIGKDAKILLPVKKEYEYIRNHIIGNVYERFFNLYQNKLRRKFLMFLTDAVATTTDMSRQVQTDFLKDGYYSKKKTIEFTKVDRKNRVVYWYDFTAKQYDDAGKLIKTGVERYYIYADHQILPDLDLDHDEKK